MKPCKTCGPIKRRFIEVGDVEWTKEDGVNGVCPECGFDGGPENW